jgi:hypothetical protein
MEVVFDSRNLPAGKRRQAWRDAICEIYLQVDCRTDLDVEYVGLVREARLGRVTSPMRSFPPKPYGEEATKSAGSERIVTT